MRRVVDGLGGFAGRGACTDAERRAALWLHGELRARGRDAWVETRWVRPQRAAALALACLAAVAGGLLSTAAPVAGLALAALGLVALAADALGRNPLLVLFPRLDDHLRRERLLTQVLEIGPCGGGRPQHHGRRIACVDERGIAPRAHQSDDLPEHVDDDAMKAALAFALEHAERREVVDRL
jgi:hypothetical protein